MANKNTQVSNLFYLRRIIAEKSTNPDTGEEVLWPKNYDKDIKLTNGSIWFIQDSQTLKISQITFYNAENKKWDAPFDIEVDNENVILLNGQDLKTVIGNYTSDYSIAELLHPIRNMINSSVSIAGLVPAPTTKDIHKILFSDGHWKSSNFIGTLEEWNSLSLVEKKEYNTVDLIKRS